MTQLYEPFENDEKLSAETVEGTHNGFRNVLAREHAFRVVNVIKGYIVAELYLLLVWRSHLDVQRGVVVFALLKFSTVEGVEQLFWSRTLEKKSSKQSLLYSSGPKIAANCSSFWLVSTILHPLENAPKNLNKKMKVGKK